MPFLSDYLFHLYLYDYPKDLLSLYFTVQGEDETYNTLKQFQKEYSDEYKKIKVKRVKQEKGGFMPQIRNVVRCRNLMIKWSNPDTVFFNDHDNLNPPVSIKRLQQGLALGASIAAGAYIFLNRSAEDNKTYPHFTTFYLKEDQKLYSLGLNKQRKGYFPAEIFGRRMWVDAVACGCMLVKRELLDELQFFVPHGTTMSDDTAFCLKARSLGHRIIADMGLIVEHWGYDVRLTKMMMVEVDQKPVMKERRARMRETGVYEHPEVDVNMNEAVRKLIDIEKIK